MGKRTDVLRPRKVLGRQHCRLQLDADALEIELRAPIPAGPPERSVRCTFAAKRLNLAFIEAGSGTTTEVASGELTAAIAASDCLWSVEREADGSAVAVVSIKKSANNVWDKLFASDAVPTEKPALLDGLERTAPPTKAELLKQAKERIATELTDGPSKAKPFALENLSGAERTLSKEELPELPVIIVRNCTDCTIWLPAGINVIKLQLEHCKQCTVDVRCRLLTETVEVWECDGCKLLLCSMARTVQLDKCSALDLAYLSAAFFDRIMHTGVRKSRVAFADSPFLDATLDLDEQQAKMPEGSSTTPPTSSSRGAAAPRTWPPRAARRAVRRMVWRAAACRRSSSSDCATSSPRPSARCANSSGAHGYTRRSLTKW